MKLKIFYSMSYKIVYKYNCLFMNTNKNIKIIKVIQNHLSTILFFGYIIKHVFLKY